MLLIKISSIAISLVYVPLLIHELDVFNYGIWLTITSLIAWLNLFDIGLGNGLRNRLAEAVSLGEMEKAKIYVSTAYFAIISLVLIILIFFFFISPHVNWCSVLNAPIRMQRELYLLINTVFVFFCFQLVLRLMNSVLYGLQKPEYAAFIILVGQLTSLTLVICVVNFFPNPSLLHLGVVISLAPVTIFVIFSVYNYSKQLRQLAPSFGFIRINCLKRIMGLGIKFFLLQIITIVLFQTSNIIIAQMLGQGKVAEYNVAYKYIGLISMLFTIVITPFWSASTEAYSRNDFLWIKKSAKKLNLVWGVLACAGLIMVLASRVFYRLWLGSKLEANHLLLALVFVYFVLRMRYGIYGYMLNGIGKVNLQLLVTSILSIAYIPLAVLLIKHLGLYGIIVAMIFVAFSNSTWSYLQFKKVVNNTATGIWNS